MLLGAPAAEQPPPIRAGHGFVRMAEVPHGPSRSSRAPISLGKEPGVCQPSPACPDRIHTPGSARLPWGQGAVALCSAGTPPPPRRVLGTSERGRSDGCFHSHRWDGKPWCSRSLPAQSCAAPGAGSITCPHELPSSLPGGLGQQHPAGVPRACADRMPSQRNSRLSLLLGLGSS